MGIIVRDVRGAAADAYDVIVIGGGIYGVMMLLEGTLRGQRVLLLEKNDFGSATSFNNFRIVHGGLRYLQSMNLRRFFESVEARRWFLRHFEALTKPLPCLMPLYGEGFKRPLMLRIALLMNHVFSLDRNRGVAPKNQLPIGGVRSPEESQTFSSYIDKNGLLGCALWYDASMIDSHRIIIETIRWACGAGGRALNYVHVDEVLSQRHHVAGVGVRDTLSGDSFEIRGQKVINAAGPWCVSFLTASERSARPFFIKSIAWNILFDRPAISTCALAMSSPKRKGQTYFVQSWNGKLFAGTGHAAVAQDRTDPMPTDGQLTAFIEEINSALPGLELSMDQIIRVLAGYLPVREPESTQLTTQACIVDHGQEGGLAGLFSVSGVKFTTAYDVARKLFDRAGIDCRAESPMIKPDRKCSFIDQWDAAEALVEMATMADLKHLVEEEAVVHLGDLLFRRMNLMDRPAWVLKHADEIGRRVFQWSEKEREWEVGMLKGWLHEGKWVVPDAPDLNTAYYH
ncbi:MAG: FAD-dependent oxidoreductase [Nitrospiria bacterium]